MVSAVQGKAGRHVLPSVCVVLETRRSWNPPFSLVGETESPSFLLSWPGNSPLRALLGLLDAYCRGNVLFWPEMGPLEPGSVMIEVRLDGASVSEGAAFEDFSPLGVTALSFNGGEPLLTVRFPFGEASRMDPSGRPRFGWSPFGNVPGDDPSFSGAKPLVRPPV